MVYHHVKNLPILSRDQKVVIVVVVLPLLLVVIVMGVMVYHCLHGQAPRYLADHLITSSDVASQLRLRSANRHQLIVPRCRLNTYGRRAFSIAGPTVWNSLPDGWCMVIPQSSNHSSN